MHENPFEKLDDEMDEIRPSINVKKEVEGSYNASKSVLSGISTIFEKFATVIIGMLSFLNPPTSTNNGLKQETDVEPIDFKNALSKEDEEHQNF